MLFHFIGLSLWPALVSAIPNVADFPRNAEFTDCTTTDFCCSDAFKTYTDVRRKRLGWGHGQDHFVVSNSANPIDKTYSLFNCRDRDAKIAPGDGVRESAAGPWRMMCPANTAYILGYSTPCDGTPWIDCHKAECVAPGGSPSAKALYENRCIVESSRYASTFGAKDACSPFFNFADLGITTQAEVDKYYLVAWTTQINSYWTFHETAGLGIQWAPASANPADLLIAPSGSTAHLPRSYLELPTMRADLQYIACATGDAQQIKDNVRIHIAVMKKECRFV